MAISLAVELSPSHNAVESEGNGAHALLLLVMTLRCAQICEVALSITSRGRREVPPGWFPIVKYPEG